MSAKGGLVEQVAHTIEIEAPPSAIPESLSLDVTELHLNESLSVADLKDLPDKVKVISEETTVIVHCVPPMEEPDQEGVAAEAGEPEVIGEKYGRFGRGIVRRLIIFCTIAARSVVAHPARRPARELTKVGRAR